MKNVMKGTEKERKKIKEKEER